MIYCKNTIIQIWECVYLLVSRDGEYIWINSGKTPDCEPLDKMPIINNEVFWMNVGEGWGYRSCMKFNEEQWKRALENVDDSI